MTTLLNIKMPKKKKENHFFIFGYNKMRCMKTLLIAGNMYPFKSNILKLLNFYICVFASSFLYYRMASLFISLCKTLCA